MWADIKCISHSWRGKNSKTGRSETFMWDGYLSKDFSFVEFAPDMRVLDVGCGNGMQLKELERRGCTAIGIDADWTSLVSCRGQGLRVLWARAEQIPVKDASLDGLVCKVVIPYTHEARAFREVSRILKKGAVCYCCYHGAGYYLRYLLIGPSWDFRLYALRTLVNTWFYAFTGQRLPGFLGDTLYQTRRRLARYYSRNGLRLLQETLPRTFLGLPVFVYHSLQKATD